MNETMISFSTVMAAVLAIGALITLFSDALFRDKAQIQKRLQNEFQLPEKQNSPKSPLFRDLKMLQSKTSGGNGWREIWAKFPVQVEQSGLSWSPVMIALAAVLVSLLLAIVACFLTHGVIIPIAVGVSGLSLPFFVVEFFRHRRRERLCQQLPDAFDQMKRAVRAGQPLSTAMQQIALDFPAPLGDEFAMCCQKQELGLSQTIAMHDLARRVNIMELQMFVVAVLVQRDVGGNAAEMLGNLAGVVRQRFRLTSRVKALTAEGRMQAVVLALMPFLAGGIMMFMNFEYAQVLIDQPKILTALLISEVIGVLWIRRIVNFDY